MKKSILVIVIILLLVTSCIRKQYTSETDTWEQIANHEWSNNYGFAGDGFYFYLEEEVPTCSYFVYGSEEPVIYSSTSEVFINEEGAIQVSISMDMEEDNPIDIILKFENDIIFYDDKEYIVQFEGNSSDYLKLNPSEEILEVEVTNIIRVWDSRTGNEYYITQNDYISRIISLIGNLKYKGILDKPNGVESSYTIFFEKEDKTIITTINMSLPEDCMYINGVCYDVNYENKVLLYAYISDAMYLKSNEESQIAITQDEELVDDIIEPNEDVIDTLFIGGYIPHKWSDYGGYYHYSSEESPLIYPNGLAPHVSEDVELWLKENPLVEVIMRTNKDMYLVRIPTIENYVYVSESSLKVLGPDDIPEIPEVNLSFNNCRIGDSIEKLKFTITGKTTYGVENGIEMVAFSDTNTDSGFQDKALATVDEYKRIIGIRFSSNEVVLDGRYRVGDLAIEVLDYYDNKFGRDESHKNDGYNLDDERYVYIIGDYYLELFLNEIELTDQTLIQSVLCEAKWW